MSSAGENIDKRSGETSLSLLERVKSDAPEAWEKLTFLYSPLIYHWCQRSGLQKQDAADVVQEVFRMLATHIYSFRRDRAGGTFRGWLWTITRSKIYDFFEARRREPQPIGGSDVMKWISSLAEQEPVEPEDPSDPSAIGGLVNRGLELIRGDFEETTWAAFIATAIESRSSTEVASELGITPNAVRKAKARVLHRLREELDGLIE